MPFTKKTEAAPAAEPKVTGDVGETEVQIALGDATAQGYFGDKTDPEPNSVYTVAGVTKGK